jgi:putative transcriptional regulator
VWVVVGWVWWGGGAPAFAQAEVEPVPPGKGVFLIASPTMTDPNFARTVVLICEFNDEGALGLIVNRPTGVPLVRVLPDLPVLKGTSYVLFAGGPVQPGAILMLFRVQQAPPKGRAVMENVYLGGDEATLERVITKPLPTETFRAFAGYAGWAPKQLEFEMAMGSWATVKADAVSVFDRDPANLWDNMIESLRVPGTVRWSPDFPVGQASPVAGTVPAHRESHAGRREP